MVIKKKLKNITFDYNFDIKILGINKPTLTRSEMFSLARFIIRIAQKGKPRKGGK